MIRETFIHLPSMLYKHTIHVFGCAFDHCFLCP